MRDLIVRALTRKVSEEHARKVASEVVQVKEHQSDKAPKTSEPVKETA